MGKWKVLMQVQTNDRPEVAAEVEADVMRQDQSGAIVFLIERPKIATANDQNVTELKVLSAFKHWVAVWDVSGNASLN